MCLRIDYLPSLPDHPISLVKSVDELNRRTEWFADASRPSDKGPFLVVVDGFYSDPDYIRAEALRQPFVQYAPPLPEQVDEEDAASHSSEPPYWFSSALLRYKGKTVRKPFEGFRYAPDSLREKLSQMIAEDIPRENWDQAGDWWNGAFHLINANRKGDQGAVHHHYRNGDVAPRGWSGLVYLSPDAPRSSGTTIWRDKESGLCVATYGSKFYYDIFRFELALLVENVFNRLVLFRENVLHRAEHGFGQGKNARLTQTFFFPAIPYPSAKARVS
jgi:hypothetical protein